MHEWSFHLKGMYRFSIAGACQRLGSQTPSGMGPIEIVEDRQMASNTEALKLGRRSQENLIRKSKKGGAFW
jgi:hypothetical protein